MTIFCNHLAKLLQKIIASPPNTWHVTIFCNHLAKFILPKRRFWTVWRVFSKHFSASSSPNQVLTPLKSASKAAFHNRRLGGVKLLQKIIASPKTQYIASHVATFLCNHSCQLYAPYTRPRNPRIPIARFDIQAAIFC